MSNEGPEMKLAREQAEKTSFDEPIILDSKGLPLIQISCAAAELIPTKQYGNVTVGPIVVKRYVEDNGIDDLKIQIKATQELCEEAVSDDRESVHAFIRQSTEGRYTN